MRGLSGWCGRFNRDKLMKLVQTVPACCNVTEYCGSGTKWRGRDGLYGVACLLRKRSRRTES